MRRILIAIFVCFFPLIVCSLATDVVASHLPQDKAAKRTSNPLDFVPKQANQILVVRPAEIVTSNDYRTLKSKLGKVSDRVVERITDQYFKLGLSKLDEIDSLTFANWISKDESQRPSSIVVLKTLAEKASSFDLATHGIVEEFEFKQQEFLRLKRPMREFGFAWIANNNTIVWGRTKESIEAAIVAGEREIRSAKWYKTWNPFKDAAISFILDDVLNEAALSRAPEPLRGFKEVQTIVGTCNPVFDLELKINGVCNSSSAAKRVKELVPTAIELAKSALGSAEPGEHSPERLLYEHALKMLDKATVKTDANIVQVRSSIDVNPDDWSVPFDQMYAASKRTFAANNMRQNALAMHNFESAMGGFPTSVMVHPETGKEYSWRIAILPYIEQNDLYQQYNFSQDWDSPHNLRVTSKMPDVFRADWDDTDSTNTSFFLLTGPGSAFGGEKALDFSEMMDGSSNTIMGVEAQRDVHWAKPEDIVVDPEQPFPNLGGFHEGGFNVTMIDGSVRFLSEDVLPDVLRSMFTPSGGEVVTSQDLNPPAQSEESPDSKPEDDKG